MREKKRSKGRSSGDRPLKPDLSSFVAPANFSAEIETEFFGSKLRSPTMLASGVLGISFDLFPRIVSNGCGVVVSKSIGVQPREGYRNPTMTAVECGYLNAIGLANPGIDEFAKELENYESKGGGVPLVVSIFADSAEHFGVIAGKLERFDFLGLELNLSCPHVKDVGSEIGTNPVDAAEVVRQVKLETRKPVLAKMPATVPNVQLWAKTVEDAGADAIVAINTVRAMRIDIDARKPILSNRIGGLSGIAIKPIGVRCVYEIYESVEIPVIGVGGVSSWRDAIEYFLAGARLVQIGSAMAASFLSTFGSINEGISGYLRSNGYSRMEDLVGLAHN